MLPTNGALDGPPYTIAWDKEHGGYRGHGAGWATKNYVTREEVVTAIEGAGGWLGGAERSVSDVGLVYTQQSLGGSPAPQQRGRTLPREERLEQLAQVREAKKIYRDTAQRWRYILCSDEAGTFSMDSKAVRVARCSRRVHAWADALPKDSRVVRRAGRRLNIGARTVMLTLTYRDVDGWLPNQIREFMLGLRKVLGGALYGYAWVLEMQERGAPHYHVLLYVRNKTDVPQPDSSGLWPHGVTRRETTISPFYICKYVGKEYQKEGLPHGARMFAVQIFKYSLSSDDMLPFRKSAAPAWLAEFIDEAAELLGSSLKWSRSPGGGWVIKDTGEVIPSPYTLISIEPWID